MSRAFGGNIVFTVLAHGKFLFLGIFYFVISPWRIIFTEASSFEFGHVRLLSRFTLRIEALIKRPMP